MSSSTSSSSSSSSVPRTRKERLERSVFTGHHLTDMQILVEADDETFDNLCQTNLRLRDICTNPRYVTQLYELRVQTRFPEYYHLFGEEWGRLLKTNKLVKPTWKTIYQNLIIMKKANILRLLDETWPLSYESSLAHLGYGVDLHGIMALYPDIFKFVYPVNPSLFSSVGKYADTDSYVWPAQWKETVGVLRWLLELDVFEPTRIFLLNAVKLGYGPFIRYLVKEKGLLLNRTKAISALLNGAGDILDLMLGVEGAEDLTKEATQKAGMRKALQRGNIEGLEAFHQRGIRLADNDIHVNLYPKETISWLRTHGYAYADSPAFRK